MNVPSYFPLLTRAEQAEVIEKLRASGLSNKTISSLTGLSVLKIREIMVAPNENEAA